MAWDAAPVLWDSADRRGPGRRARAVSAWAPATRCAWRRACPSTATSSIATVNPFEAGLGRVVRLDKPGDFVGRAALEAACARPLSRTLVGLVLRERGIARHGYPRLPPSTAAAASGVVTSGSVSPTLGVAIAMAYVPPDASAVGTMVEVGIRGARVAAEVVRRLPFYVRSATDKESCPWTCPTELRYTDDHEWLRVEGDARRAWASPRYAADQLGDIVFVELPAVGARFERGKTFGVIESVKTVSDLYAPVAGEVMAVNAALADAAGAGEQRSVRRGLDGPVAPRATRPQADALQGRRGLPRADRGRLTHALRPAHRGRSRAHARGARARLGRALFDDIPAAVRGARHGPAGAAAGAGAGAAPGDARGAQPGRPGQLPGGRRLPPLPPGRSSTRCCRGASSTRPTRRTSRRSARARCRRSTSTSRCSPS